MTDILYVSQYKKDNKSITPIMYDKIISYDYEVVSGVGDNISVNGKTYVIGKIQYVYGGDTIVCRDFYVLDKFSKEVL